MTEPYVPPETSVFDEDGNVVEFGAKFYSPENELAIMPAGSNEWQNLSEYLDQRQTEVEDDEAPIPVSDEDLTFWPYGR